MTDEVSSLSGKVGLDVTDYKAGVAELNRQIRVVESGFRASAAALGDWGKSVDGLEMRIGALTQEIDLQRQKVSNLTAEYEKIAAAQGKDSRAAQEMQIKINRATEELGKMEHELNATEKELEQVGDESDKTGKDLDELSKKTDHAKTKTEVFGKVIGGLKTALAVGVASILALTAAVAGVGLAITKLVLDTAGTADGLVEMSDKTGISTERLQELSYISGQVGTDLDTITGSMAKMIRSMSSAQSGTGASADAFRRLGISITDSSGNLRDSQAVFSETIDALGRVSNETERDALAMALFGKSAQELNPLIKAGSAEMARLSQEAHQVGAVMSDENVRAMADFSDELESLKASLKGTLGTLAVAFLPAMRGLVGYARTYLGEFSQIVRNSNGDLVKMAEGIGGLLGRIANDIAAKGPQLLQAGLSIVQGIITAIVTNLPQLIPAAAQVLTTFVQFIVQNLPILMRAGVDLILALVDGILPQLPMLVDAGLKMLLMLADGIAKALPRLMPIIAEIIPKIIIVLIDNLPLLLDVSLQIIIALIEGLAAALPKLIEAIPSIVEAIANAIIASLPLIGKAAVKLVIALLEGIIKAAPALVKANVEMVNVIIKGFASMVNYFLKIGVNMVEGIWAGIKSRVDWFKNNIMNFFQGIINGINGLLKSHSPSMVFAGIGENMAAGLSVGFAKEFRNVEQQISGAMNGLQTSLNVNAAAPATAASGSGIRIEQNFTITGSISPDEDYRLKRIIKSTTEDALYQAMRR